MLLMSKVEKKMLSMSSTAIKDDIFKYRSEYIDMARGIGILLVIFGHCMSSPNAIVSWQCSFFMPLFFMCSGLCTNKIKTIKMHAARILSPYYFWGGIGLILEIMMLVIKHSLSSAVAAKEIIYYVLGMSTYNYPLWFLSAFFICKCIFDRIRILTKDAKNQNAVQTGMAIGCVAIGLVLALIRKRYVFFYPFRFDIGFTMIPFLLLGYRMKDYFRKTETIQKSRQVLMCGGFLIIN